jgi:ribonucleoside-diphosphate reductase beta chain
MLLSFHRQNKMKGIGQQIEYTTKDEISHSTFGITLVNTIKNEYPKLWTEEFQNDVISYIKKATELEINYAHDVLPNGVLGLNASMFIDYMQYLANDRLEKIGLPKQFEPKTNPFPWLDETFNISKKKNFFETNVTEYKVAAQIKDDL